MLRPERMSKVSVTGAKPVMDDVIGTVHDLNLVHLSEYDGSWEGFSPGEPAEGAEGASEKLVTVRSLRSILDVEAEDAGPERVVSDEALETELEEVRQEANELDDRRDEIESKLREIEDDIDSMALFEDVGIDLDLLWGYETLEVAVGRGNEDAIDAALEESDAVDVHETFAGDRAVAVFVRPAEGRTQVVNDALVGVQFETVQIPESEGEPDARADELRHEKRQLESKLDTVEDEIEDLRLEAAGFLLAAEERLTIEVQKTEAPLRFATTENSFIAEGWIPTQKYDEFVAALHEDVGEHVEIEELERASYSEHGHPEHTEEVEESGAGGGPGEPTAAADGGEKRTATDGGSVVTMRDDPPTVLDNNDFVAPMELLVNTVGRPKYTEFDPTWLVFLTFPAFFGYMIGDVGYGIGYAAVGYLMMTRVDSEGVQKLGAVGVWAGVFTAIFGVLYGEFLGLHAFGELIWGEHGLIPLGHPPIEKGLTASYFAQAWMLVTLVVGLLHVTLGHVMSFAKEYHNHSLKAAVFESGSWIVLMIGVWGWIGVVLPNLSPRLIGSAFGTPGMTVGGETIEHVAFPIGFSGLPDVLLFPMIGVIAVGFVMLVIGEGVKAVEVLQVLVNVLSYMRLMAVLLAKAGMAFVVNLFVFGLYESEGTVHFLTFADHHVEASHVVFEGMFNMGAAWLIPGVLVLVVGHLIVFALGITSAGLQAMRLEYVEFFGKFYDGGGRTYNPFGYRREHTTEE